LKESEQTGTSDLAGKRPSRVQQRILLCPPLLAVEERRKPVSFSYYLHLLI
jgi:hypothetical protein